MADLGRRLREATALDRAPHVDHAALQRRGRRARTRARVAGVAMAVVLAGVLGVGVFGLFEDQSAERVIFTQPGATATTSRDLENPSDAPTAGEVAFYLDLTNQSYEVPSVRLRVSIDGEPVVDRVMDVKDQHHVERFPLALQPGEHTITVRLPDRGEETTSDFVVDFDTWLSVTYWGPDMPQDERIDIHVSEEEIQYG